MSLRIGECGLCKTQKVELKEHHVVEYLDRDGIVPKIMMCQDCHVTHEKYKNYLKNVCGIDIDRKYQDWQS